MAQQQELTGLIVKIKADLAEYLPELAKMDQASEKTGSKVASRFTKVGDALSVLGTGIGAFAATAMNSAMTWGKAVDDLSDKTGMAGDEASKLLAIGQRAGVSTELTNAAFGKFSKTISTTTAAIAKANAEGKTSDDVFTKLGISTLTADGSMRSTLDIFKDVTTSLSGMEDGWQKTAIEMELFGRSGYELHDMLNMSNEEIDRTIERAKALGLIISTETAAAWEKFDRDLNEAKGTMAAIGVTVGNEMMPPLRNLLGQLQALTKAYVGMDDEQKKSVNTVLQMAAASGSAVMALRALELAAGVAAPPWLKLALAIAGATYALSQYIDESRKVTGYGGGGEITLERERDGKGGWTNSYYVKNNQSAGGKRRMTADELQAYQENQSSSASLKGDESYLKTLNDPSKKAEISRQMAEDKFKKDMDAAQNKYLGIGATPDSAKKSAFKNYQDETQDLMAIWQSQLDLEEISRAQFQTLVSERLGGLKDVVAVSSEVTDKEKLEYSLREKMLSLGQAERQETIQTASQKVQLGEMTVAQYAEVIKKQREMATTDKERLDLAVRLMQTNIELMNREIAAQGYLLAAKKASLSQQNEAERHSLEMIKISADDQLSTKKRIIDLEYQAKIKALNDNYEAEARTLDKIIEKLKENNQQDKAEYTAKLEEKKRLEEQYRLETERANNEHTERIASQNQAVIDTNNQIIADLITGTRSGHDILKQMWRDYVAQVIAEQFKISSSMNIFSGLLGGLFGGSSSKSVLGTTSSNGFYYDPNFGIKLSGARAAGGPVEAGKAYLVGEKRPEIFVPNMDGSIIPDARLFTQAMQGGNNGGNGQSNGLIVHNTFHNTFSSLDPAAGQDMWEKSWPQTEAKILESIRYKSSWTNAIREKVK